MPTIPPPNDLIFDKLSAHQKFNASQFVTGLVLAPIISHKSSLIFSISTLRSPIENLTAFNNFTRLRITSGFTVVIIFEYPAHNGQHTSKTPPTARIIT